MKKHEHAYGQLSIAEKRAESLARAREPSIQCSKCDTHVTPTDLVAHTERCPGLREPGPGAKWVDGRNPIVRSVPKATLHYWVKQGFVRVRGERMDREYLLRDLAPKVARRMGLHRR